MAEAVGPQPGSLSPSMGWCCNWPGRVSVCRDLCGSGIPARRQWGAHSQEPGQNSDPPASHSGLSRSRVLQTHTPRESELAGGLATWPDVITRKVNISWIFYGSWGTSHSQISDVTNREDFRALRGVPGWQASLSSEHYLSPGRGDEKQAHNCPWPFPHDTPAILCSLPPLPFFPPWGCYTHCSF